MLGLVRHARACPRFSKITKQQYLWEGFELFCLFVAWSYTSKEATVLSCCFRWVWSSMPKDLWSKKSPISLERVEWFCRFFASSHLHLLRYSLKLQKYAIFDFLLQLKLEEICYFGLWLQNTLGQSVCRILLAC